MGLALVKGLLIFLKHASGLVCFLSSSLSNLQSFIQGDVPRDRGNVQKVVVVERIYTRAFIAPPPLHYHASCFWLLLGYDL